MKSMALEERRVPAGSRSSMITCVVQSRPATCSPRGNRFVGNEYTPVDAFMDVFGGLTGLVDESAAVASLYETGLKSGCAAPIGNWHRPLIGQVTITGRALTALPDEAPMLITVCTRQLSSFCPPRSELMVQQLLLFAVHGPGPAYVCRTVTLAKNQLPGASTKSIAYTGVTFPPSPKKILPVPPRLTESPTFGSGGNHAG